MTRVRSPSSTRAVRQPSSGAVRCPRCPSLPGREPLGNRRRGLLRRQRPEGRSTDELYHRRPEPRGLDRAVEPDAYIPAEAVVLARISRTAALYPPTVARCCCGPGCGSHPRVLRWQAARRHPARDEPNVVVIENPCLASSCSLMSASNSDYSHDPHQASKRSPAERTKHRASVS